LYVVASVAMIDNGAIRIASHVQHAVIQSRGDGQAVPVF